MTQRKSSKKQSATPSYQKGVVVSISRKDIVPDDINPRTITDENRKRLKESIEKNGLVGHPVWNRTTGHIVGGHQRIDALDSLMRTKDYPLDVLAVEMPLKDEIRLNVALNNQDSQGEFNFDAIAELARDFDLDLSTDFGFSDDVIEVNFPEFSMGDIGGGTEPQESRSASEEDIAHMKEMKKKVRERNKEFREEFGDFNGEPKGILTVVFDSESAKRQYFLDRGVENPPGVMHVYDFEKILKKET